MDYSNFRFCFSAIYVILVFTSIIKNEMCRTVLHRDNRYKFLLIGFLTSMLVSMFFCNRSGHGNASYCMIFIGFVPLLIAYYCVYLATKSFEGLKKLFQGKKFDEILSIFFMLTYLPTFVAVVNTIKVGNFIAIHQYEPDIFIVTMFLLVDIFSSFFEET